MKSIFLLAVMLSSSLLFGQYKIGDKADNFTLQNVDGKMVSLSDFNTDGVVVVFTCNTCPYAKMYESRLIQLHKKYADQGFPVVAINPNDPELKAGDSFDEMKRIAQEENYPFVYLFDKDQKVFPAFGATKTPHVFLLNKNREVSYIGAIDDNAQSQEAVEDKYLENAILALKEGKSPSPDMTKAIGCGIKSRN